MDSFYTDDSSSYLQLFPDGFKQLVRVNEEACQQIVKMSVVLKDDAKKQSAVSVFKELPRNTIPKIYGLDPKDYCWYSVEIHGVSLDSEIKYILKIEDSVNNQFFFRGITNSLIPTYRISEKWKSDIAWIDLGAFGATPVVGGGVFYKAWEPLAKEVHLFLNEGRPIKMNSDFPLNDERRFHFIYVKNSKLDDSYYYKFIKNNTYEKVQQGNFNGYSEIKVDPMAREISYEAKGGKLNAYQKPRGIVKADGDFVWKRDEWLKKLKEVDYNNWIIYQLWPLTFNPKKINGTYTQGKFLDIVPKIPYLSGLGINAVEFLPVFESRFYASWGYALDSLIALENTLGKKNDMKNLIDNFHGNQIRVIFDVVLNHVNNSLLAEPVDSNINVSKFYGGNTAWGPKPRFESIWVRKWMTDSLLYLMTEYHLDGFRFDMTDSIFRETAGGYRFLQELIYLIKVNNPKFYNSAEQLPDDVWVTYPVSQKGLGFDSQWNDRFKNFFELEFDNYNVKNHNVDLTHLANSLLGFSDHETSKGSWYHFGDPQRTVNYLGSHDFIGNKDPILRIVTQYKGQEKEDNNIFTRVNPLEESGDVSIPFRRIHNQFSHALARLAYGILFTKPGAALFYQGEEVAQDLNIENEWSYLNALKENRFPSKNINIGKYVGSHRMTWHYVDLIQGRRDPLLSFITTQEEQLFSGHYNFFKEMISFKKNNPEINNRDAENVKIDNFLKTVTYELRTPRDSFFVVGNFNADNGEAWVKFPGSPQTWWREVVNSSDLKFGSDVTEYQNIISNLGGRENLLRLKGPGFYIFKAESKPGLTRKLYFRVDALKWIADESTELRTSAKNNEELIVKFLLEKEMEFEFKLGTKNWEVDLGKSPEQLAQVLTYIPYSSNAVAKLEAGNYTFVFNIKNFTYKFEKTELNRDRE